MVLRILYTRSSPSSKRTTWHPTCSMSFYIHDWHRRHLMIRSPLAAKWQCGLLQLRFQGAQKHLLGWQDWFLDVGSQGLACKRYVHKLEMCLPKKDTSVQSGRLFLNRSQSCPHLPCSDTLGSAKAGNRLSSALDHMTTCGEWSEVMSTTHGQISSAIKWFKM